MISPNPVDPVFGVFILPPNERLQALTEHLARGTDPNAVDPRLNRYESLLAHACRSYSEIGKVSLPDPALVQVLLDRGANPLVSQIWASEVGEMTNLIDRMAFLAWEDRDHLSTVTPPSKPTPIMDIMDALLVACQNYRHVDEGGCDALGHMARNLSAFSHVHYVHPFCRAVELGFDLHQPIEDGIIVAPNLVAYLLNKHAKSALRKHWIWNCVGPVIEKAMEANQIKPHQDVIWEAVDAWRDHAEGDPGFDKLQSTRQALIIQQATPAVALGKPRLRV